MQSLEGDAGTLFKGPVAMEICSGQTDPPCACRASVLITETPQSLRDGVDLCRLKKTKTTDRGRSDPTLEEIFNSQLETDTQQRSNIRKELKMHLLHC